MSSVDSSAQYAKQLEDDLLTSTPSKGVGEGSSQTPEKKRQMRGIAQKKRKQKQKPQLAKKKAVPENTNEKAPPKKRRGGRQKITYTAEDRSSGYTIDPNGDAEERKRRTEHITRRWARKWYNYECITDRYTMRFAFTPPWSDLVSLNVAEERQTEHPPPPTYAHTSTLNSSRLSRGG